jgi:hypothetical protein
VKIARLLLVSWLLRVDLALGLCGLIVFTHSSPPPPRLVDEAGRPFELKLAVPIMRDPAPDLSARPPPRRLLKLPRAANPSESRRLRSPELHVQEWLSTAVILAGTAALGFEMMSPLPGR